MGRFLNARAVSARPPIRIPERHSPLSTAVAEPVPEAAGMPAEAPTPVVSSVVTIGLYSLGVYLIAGYATDLSYRFLGTKPYLSMIGIVVFICFLLSGNAMAAVRTTAGKLWLGVGLWMCVSSVFSSWRTGSIDLMLSYIPKQHMMLFYIAALAVTAKYCRTLVRFSIFGSFILVLTCAFFGHADPDSGRLGIAGNPYLSNPNDLAMQLLVAIGFFLYWIRQPGLLGRVGGVIGGLGAAYFLLKTGSRGGVLAAVVLAALWIFFSENRLLIVGMAVPAMLLMLVLAPRQTLDRLTFIALHPEQEAVSTLEEEKAVTSQMARTYLFKRSLNFAVHHPIFGVGPGEFADILESEGKREGRHETSLGTHNTYTQLASECGTPALIMFVAAIVVTIRSSYRLYKATMHDPTQATISSLAFICFVLTVAYSIDIFFHHMAYYGNMPLLLGLWIAVDLAARRSRMAQQAAVAA